MDGNLEFLEIDVDGVLANMDGAYAPYIHHIIPDFSEEKYIVNWNMPEVARDYPAAIEIMRGLWRTPAFLTQLDRYTGVIEGFILLKEFVAEHPNIGVIVHSHVFGPEMYDARYNWVDAIRQETNFQFDIDLSVGDTKRTLNSLIVIEDNVSNLQKSNAQYKYLIRRGHNRRFTECDLGNYTYAKVASSFLVAVQDFIQVYDKITTA